MRVAALSREEKKTESVEIAEDVVADLIPPAAMIGAESSIYSEIIEIGHYRNLMFFLCWRDLKVRYKQTLLGASWAIAQPLFTMGVFSIVFGRIAKIPSEGIPYPLFSLSALIPWIFFSGALTRASLAIVNNGHLIAKIYFPRLIVPLSSVLTGGVDLGISLVFLIAMMLLFGYVPPLRFFAILPFIVLWIILLALGIGLTFSALHIRFRDIGHALPLMMQLWMYLTPVIYPSSTVPEKYQWLLPMNPMTGAIDSFRSLLFGLPWNAQAAGISVTMTLIFLCIGIVYFHKRSTTFADVV